MEHLKERDPLRASAHVDGNFLAEQLAHDGNLILHAFRAPRRVATLPWFELIGFGGLAIADVFVIVLVILQSDSPYRFLRWFVLSMVAHGAPRVLSAAASSSKV